jgi:hypothetical protein
MKIKDARINDKNTLNLTSWKEYIDFINGSKDQLKNCIYRGQRDPSWKLEPSFFRLMPKEFNWQKVQNPATNIQLENFKKFTRGRHGISYDNPSETDNDWWTLGQHYGLATPLLDWVRSPYVAAFFSFLKESDQKERAIYILDIKKIIDTNGNSSAIKTVDPLTHENKRLVSQQGLFTYIYDYKYRNLEDYLSDLQEKCNETIDKDEIFLLKITIPSSQKQPILEQLNLMNINKATLFPDLNGSAEHCNYLLKQALQ